MAVIVALVVLGVCILIIAVSVSIFRSEEVGAIAKAIIGLVLIALAALPACIIIRLRSTPPAQQIRDVLHIADASQQLLVRSIEMPAPSYLSGKGWIEKSYTSVVAVDVTNNSDQETYLGLEYYADSGSIGPYSPGAAARARVLAVPPKWSGKLEFPLNHPRFVGGGYIKVTLAKCKAPGSETLFLPPDSERLFEKKYDIAPEQISPNQRMQRTSGR